MQFLGSRKMQTLRKDPANKPAMAARTRRVQEGRPRVMWVDSIGHLKPVNFSDVPLQF
jgi:hypothetical protein